MQKHLLQKIKYIFLRDSYVCPRWIFIFVIDRHKLTVYKWMFEFPLWLRIWFLCCGDQWCQWARRCRGVLWLSARIKQRMPAKQRWSNKYLVCVLSFIILCREYWIILRGPGFLAVANPSPSPVSKLSLFLSLPVCRLSSILTGDGGLGGEAKS